MIHVANKRTHRRTERDVPIHRGFPLGNPFDWRGSPLAEFKVSNRAEAIAEFAKMFDEKVRRGDKVFLDELRRIYRLAKQGDVYLVCYCVPDNCHGFHIKQFLDKHL